MKNYDLLSRHGSMSARLPITSSLRVTLSKQIRQLTPRNKTSSIVVRQQSPRKAMLAEGECNPIDYAIEISAVRLTTTN
ncbi:hypothetical protein [Mangrovibacterium sp.]|uniref:hypothetical protein n=1 Tax=Mangrovibacterium sp. TaxID=1961364 RepID=UPI003564A183